MTGIGHVYKIICVTEPTFCYIGSTLDVLWKRMGTHRRNYNRWIEGKRERKCSCHPYFEKYGIENFKIVLIKSYEVCREHRKDRRHLEAYETLWINRHKGKCCNEKLPIEYLRRERQRLYYQDNKARIVERGKENYQKNKAEIIEREKERYQNNKTKIAAKNAEKVECECGCVVTRAYLTQHRKNKKHIHLMASK
jgi:hypothetical protein